MKYWLKRWKQSKDLSDSIRSGRPRGTTHKQDEQIVSLAEQQTFVTARDIANKLTKTGTTVNERTIQRRLNEAGVKYNRPLSKPLLTEVHRKNRLKWAQDNKATNWEQMIFSDETTIRLNTVKGLVWNLTGKKKILRTVKHSTKVNESLGLFFKSRFWSHRLFQAELKC